MPRSKQTRLLQTAVVTLAIAAGVAGKTMTSEAWAAGPNEGGVLAVTLSLYLGSLNENSDYCDEFTLTDCFDAEVDAESPGILLLHVFAAFPDESSPRLSGLTFGWSYPEELSVLQANHCGDFELPSASWPESGTGTAVSWAVAQTAHLVPVYWVGAIDYYGEGSILSLIPHPDQGGNFADDGNPSYLDPITAYGAFGFNTEGTLACPTSSSSGACCIGDECFLMRQDECLNEGGMFQGAGTNCDNAECGTTPSVTASWGEVKSLYR